MCKEKLESDPSEEVKSRISDFIYKLSEQSPNISDVFDTFPSEMRTPQFYILPKTHEEFDDSLPLGYPGRPIIFACNSSTDNISKYRRLCLETSNAVPSILCKR